MSGDVVKIETFEDFMLVTIKVYSADTFDEKPSVDLYG